MRNITLVLILIWLAGMLSASEFEQLKAAEERGISNPDLYYNLGVTYWQTGQSGMATLYFLKALNLDSAHKSARENLDYVIRLSQDKDMYPQRLFLVRIFLECYNFLNLNRMALLSLILLLLTALAFIWYLNYDPAKERGLPSLILGISISFLLFAVFLTGFKAYRQSHNRLAVLIDGSAELREEPREAAKRVALLHEGAVLELRKSADDWFMVSLPNGESGWLPANGVRKVLN